MLNPLKPALTYEQQIERLTTVHNLKIVDHDRAIEILSRVNYYRLSAYGIGLRKNDGSDQYKDGTTLFHLFQLYCFDSQFKNNLIHYLEQIEVQLRTQISNLLALKYGPEGYMNSNNFQEKKNRNSIEVHANIIANFRREVDHQNKVPFVKHHLNKYDGHFPIWVAVELFTFGMLTSLYDIMKHEDQKVIASYYGTTPKHLKSWLLSLVEVRNICAHYTRLYNLPLKQAPYLYKENKKYRNPNINKIFPVLLVIKRMFQGNEQWDSLYRDLDSTIKKYSSVINFSFMGFPTDWRDVLR